MPWTVDRYPNAMLKLAPWVRHKAIEIANALLDDGLSDGQAIRIGIARAKLWASHQLEPPGLHLQRWYDDDEF